MQEHNLGASRFVGKVLVAAGLALAVLGGSASLGGPAVAQNQDMMRLGDQLRNCRGDACVPLRDQMMSHLREQLQSCSGGQCDQMRERLSLHERVRDCHASDRRCRELRLQEREQVRPRYHYGTGRGTGRGAGGGMGRRMGN